MSKQQWRDRNLTVNERSTASGYARSLAYLNDAAKIRAHTLAAWGASPSLAECQAIVDARRARMRRPLTASSVV